MTLKNSEHGFLHPSGTFVTIDKDGNVSMQAVKRLTLHDADECKETARPSRLNSLSIPQQ